MSRALNAEERRRLEALFERAVDLPTEEHAGFIESECAGQDILAARLASLLAASRGTDHLGGNPTSTTLPPGTRIDAYELVEKIGAGGMGEVYAALQRDPVERRVALKVTRAGLHHESIVARFEAERQALARMTHPGVAQVFDGGTTADGRPYFVMEHVEGEPIDAYCDRRSLGTRARVELFVSVCEGVQHAHQKGLIHRDLKPSNLMVTELDGRPLPKIIDFGVARATTGSLSGAELHTMVGQIVGTLDYMSPEQADPTAVDIDTRSDIYSLGVVLYQLVSGLLPFDGLADGVNFSEVQRRIREQDPTKPSTRLRRQTETRRAIAPRHGTDDRTLLRQLSGDLDWITLKALEKDPARRYASASELAEDLRRHLAHEPVLARRPGTLYRTRKFVRRHRVSVAAGLLTASGALAGVYGVVSGNLVAQALQPQADEYAASVLLEHAAALWPPHGEDEGIRELERWIVEARELAGRLPEYSRRARRLEDDEPMQDLLGRLVSKLEILGQDGNGLLAEQAMVPGHGWSVPRRLEFAREQQQGFAPDGELDLAWSRALQGLHGASADLDGDGVEETLYPDLELRPQAGLLPLGSDPVTGLWEFAHLMTGEPPQRDDHDRLILTEKSAVVLVLIPGGTFQMGGRTALPVHPVELTPFFLSKYEMTQGQWKHLTGSNPSRFGPDGTWESEWLESGAPASYLLPVEEISWDDCMQWLSRAGLTLPSEAQWEYAARAGTTTPFWTGETSRSLEGGAGNLPDAWSLAHGGAAHQAGMRFSDGSTMQWPIGGHLANSFGLEDVHGNLYEWCLDGFDDLENFYEKSPELDPVATGNGDSPRVYRGGSYRSTPSAARSSARSYYPPGMKGHALGVRPARAITP